MRAAAARLAIVAIALCTLAAAPATREPIYDEKADARADIDAAVARAARSNKRVLLVYGGNWCGWCYKLHDLFETDQKIADLLRAEYEVVNVCIDKPEHKKVMEDYGAEQRGVPYLTILGSDGKVVVNHDTGSLEVGKKHDPAKVFSLLDAHKAPPRDAQALLTAALDRAKTSDGRVLLVFGAPWCGWCHRLESVLSQQPVADALAKGGEWIKLDLDRDTGARAIYDRYCKTPGGIPWYVVLDAAGDPIGDADDGGGNIGYPYKPDEIAGFLKLLDTAMPKLGGPELDTLRAELEAAAERITASRAKNAS